MIFRKSGKFMLVVQLRGGSSDDLQDVRTVLYVILQHQPNMDLIAGNFLVGVASKMVDGETKGLKESRVFFKKLLSVSNSTGVSTLSYQNHLYAPQ